MPPATKPFLLWIVTLLFESILPTCSGATATKPNFIFLLADDLNNDYKQDRKAIMPNLRKYLSEEGMEFANHVAVVPVCGPSRSSLLVGRFPHNVGYVANGRAASVFFTVRAGRWWNMRWCTYACHNRKCNANTNAKPEPILNLNANTNYFQP